MVKWRALDPYLDSSESDSKLYTNFELCGELFQVSHEESNPRTLLKSN